MCQPPLLAFELIIYHSFTCFCSFVCKCLSDIHSLIAIHFECQLYSSVSGSGNPAVRKFSNEC